MTSILAPEELYKRAMGSLQSCADPERALGGKRYFKPEEEVSMLGIRAAQIREKAGELYALIEPHWNQDRAVELCEQMLPNKYLEAKAVCILILERYVRFLKKEHLFVIKKWIKEDHCTNWATIDLLCPSIVSPLIEDYPELIDEVITWADSENRWLRRGAAVSFVKPARRGRFIGVVHRIARKLFPDEDDLIQKANGWLLRESGKTDRERLERFLLKHGKNIPRTTLRYAIERFPEKRRKEMLDDAKAEKRRRKSMSEMEIDSPVEKFTANRCPICQHNTYNRIKNFEICEFCHSIRRK